MENIFSQDDLDIIQNYFYKLILDRAKSGWNCSAFLADENKKLPIITNELYQETIKEPKWFAVPGMYGGFAYRLLNKNSKPLLITESWSRVVGGSGQKHEITIEGCILLEEGFV